MFSKKLVTSVFFAVLLFITTSINIFAADNKISIVPRPSQNSLFGQDHSYSVNFRGNGEAIVTLKVVFSNSSDTPLKSISLRVPKVNPTDLIALQVIREPVCIQYQNITSPLQPGVLPTCIQYQDPNFYDYYSYGSEYKRAKAFYSGDTLEVGFPQEIKPNSSGSFILYYRALGYAKKNVFGSFDYNFETLKVNDKIRSLQVGISGDSDLFLKGASGKTNYRYEEALAPLKTAGESVSMKNPQIDSVYSQIGQGEVSKNTSNLAPLESYSVRGSFSDSRIKLFAKEIFGGIIVVVVFLALVILVIKSLLGRKISNGQNPIVLNVLATLWVSFASSLLTFGYTVLVYFFGRNVSTFLSPYSNNDFQGIILFLIVIVSIAIYVLIIVIPSLVVGIKRGWLWGVLSFFSTIIWLAIYLVVVLLFLMVFGKFQNYPTPIPYSQPVQIEGTAPGVNPDTKPTKL